jgi:hypothetical protein
MGNYTFQLPSTQTANDRYYAEKIENHFASASGTNLDKLRNFSRFVPRQALSTFLAKREIFQRIVNIHGNIIECGVFMGGGLFTWTQLSSIYEPLNHTRRVIGFDSFDGFPSVSSLDKPEEQLDENFHKEVGTYRFEHKGELLESCRIHDLNRPVGHIPKVELVQGDANLTMPQYLNDNPQLVVALLYLDFDIYEPTKTALTTFLSRMPKGAVIAFDELNQKQWPGETLAVLETVGIRNLKIERVPFVPQISFAQLD